MYRNITEQCRQAINGSSRTFTASFLCDGVTYSDIKSLKISVPSALSGKINIGDTISKSVEIEIASVNILIGSKITVYEAVKLGPEEYDHIPMGKFKVSKSTTKESITTIEADGPLSIETGFGYFSELVYPATTIQMLNEISAFIGVVIETDGLEEIIVSTKPEGYTCREVIGYIAALHGTNAVETREGTIALKWYENCEEDIFTDKIDSPELENDLFVIEKFECVQGDTSIVKGAGFTGISIENPLMTEEIAESVWNKISGFSYRPGTFPIKSGTPCVDSWDSFIYNDERVIGTELEYIHDGGLQNTYRSAGESTITSASKGPMAQKMDRYYADLLLVKEAMVDALTVNEADIRYLKADSISAITLVVKEAAIAELSADFVTTESIEANYANINLSNVEKSTIGTLLADIGLITDATIVDGHVTGFLDAVEVNANSVTAGTLSVDRLVFRGAENSIVYELNNITGALQAVQSETLNGEILTDRSITVDKIVAKSITANEIATATITANELAANSITADKIVSSAITSAKIATGAITAEKIAANAITAEKIASNSITADKLDVESIFAKDITATGTINYTDNWGNTSTINMATHSITLATYSNEQYSFEGPYNISSIYPSVVCDGILVKSGTLMTARTIVQPAKVQVQDTTYEQYGIKASDGSYYLNYTVDGGVRTSHLSTDKIDCYGRMASNSVYTGSVETNTGVFHGAITVEGLKIRSKKPEKLGVNKSTATLLDIINVMNTEPSEVQFWTNTGTEYPKVNAEILAGAQTCGFAGTAIYGNVTITRISNEWTVKFEGYYNTRDVYIRRYTKTNSVGWSTWQKILTINTAVSISEGGTGVSSIEALRKSIINTRDTISTAVCVFGTTATSNGSAGPIYVQDLKTSMGLNNVNNTADSEKSVSYATNAGQLLNNSADVYMLVNSSKNFKTYVKSTGGDLDNAVTLGTSNARIKQLFAGTACNISSDRNLKDNIVPLTAIHKQFFMKLIPVSYIFKDGDSGRTHVGFISQDVEQAMSELGMSSLDFAGFCKDVKMTTRMEKVPVYDKDGNMTYIDNEVSIPNLDANGNYQYIYSLRYEEFIALIAYVLQDYIRKAETTDILLQSALSRLSMVEIQIANMAA